MSKGKIIIKDGGVEADFICPCGKKIMVSLWGIVYRRDKKGRKIGQQGSPDNLKKCKCGRSYLFICIPDIGWKELPK
jgi:hypothetical protein